MMDRVTAWKDSRIEGLRMVVLPPEALAFLFGADDRSSRSEGEAASAPPVRGAPAAGSPGTGAPPLSGPAAAGKKWWLPATLNRGRVPAGAHTGPPVVRLSKKKFDAKLKGCRRVSRKKALAILAAHADALVSHYGSAQTRPSVHAYKIETTDGDSYAYRYYGQTVADPLVFDLDLDGRSTRTADLRLDIDGDGSLELMDDIDSGDGVLVFDADRDGISGEDGTELFGNFTDVDGDGRGDGFANGFEALRAFANKAVRDRVLPARALEDSALGPEELHALEKAYGLRMRMGGLRGRAVSMSRARVARIVLSVSPTRTLTDIDGRGNDAELQPGAVFTRIDGGKGSYRDVWFRYKERTSLESAVGAWTETEDAEDSST